MMDLKFTHTITIVDTNLKCRSLNSLFVIVDGILDMSIF